MACSSHTFFFVVPAKCTVSVIRILTFDAYLLHQGEQLSPLLDQTITIEPIRNNVVIVIGLSSIWRSCSGALVSKRVATVCTQQKLCFFWY